MNKLDALKLTAELQASKASALQELVRRDSRLLQEKLGSALGSAEGIGAVAAAGTLTGLLGGTKHQSSRSASQSTDDAITALESVAQSAISGLAARYAFAALSPHLPGVADDPEAQV